MTATIERPLAGEFARWIAEADLHKWDADQTRFVADKTGLLRPVAADFDRLGVKPAEHIHVPAPANRLTTVGLGQLTARLIVAAEQAWDNTHVGLGVGTSLTADAIGDTDLIGTKRYNAMDATYPQQAAGVLTFKATYASGEAEFAWEEYGVVVADTATAFAAGAAKPANYILLNRKAPAGLGTKGAGTTWAFTVTITIV
jgi:hypothetical protein